MATRKIKVADATKEELISFGMTSLGFERPPGNIGLETMRAKVKEAWQHDDIELQEEDDSQQVGPAPRGETMRKLKDGNDRITSKGDPIVTMTLAKGVEKGGDRPHFVAVNGTAMTVPRGEKCDVPYRIWEALNNAVETHRVEDPETMEVSIREVPVFSISVHRWPDQRAIDAYLERTADLVAAA